MIDVQAYVRQVRFELLGGRGKGASTAEISRRTRGRSGLGGASTCDQLETLARQTAIARGDAEAIALDIAATRDRLTRTIESVGAKASRARTDLGRPRNVAVGGVLVLTLIVLLRGGKGR